MDKKKSSDCLPGSGCCSPKTDSVDRRSFIKTSVIGGSMALLPGMTAFAGPFDENDYLKYIPADKKLDPNWVKSLFVRGEKERYTDPKALSHIGMPVGGLFAGTVYLSGDGQLWLWDIFNKDQEGIQPREVKKDGKNVRTRDGANFVEPAQMKSPFNQGFELEVNGQLFPLNKKGFAAVEFEGRYPMGFVRYSDPSCPVEVELEVFSPFIPLNVDDSSLPLTLLRYRLSNKSKLSITCQLRGFSENPVCLDSKMAGAQGQLRNSRVSYNGLHSILFEAAALPKTTTVQREDLLFEDFESGSYGKWLAEGEAFGSGPIRFDQVPDYQGNLGGKGKYGVNSHASAPGSDVSEKDGKRGTLTSPAFEIKRKYIHFLLGGGGHAHKTCLNLIMDGKVVESIAGHNSNTMEVKGFDVSVWEGQQAQLQLVDEVSAGWGNIGLDHLVFSDSPPVSKELSEYRDFGTFCLSALEGDGQIVSTNSDESAAIKTVNLKETVTSSLSLSFELEAEETKLAEFTFSWHFPNFYGRDFGNAKVGHSYAARFTSALDVAKYWASNKSRLVGDTLDWTHCWYDSSLPYWLLDRTMANTTTLATTTCYRHKDGRFWAWEGIGCCTGTCTHVWHYAQALGRLFPEIERDQRERIDFGMALKENGEIGYRTLLNSSMGPAFDGQCGRIMGAYREHQMSKDDDFLKRNWLAIKKSVLYMIEMDADLDGILEGSQPNTLDASWFGKISFISSLYISALRAGEQMAKEIGDEKFAGICGEVAEKGANNILELYNGEFFIQKEDPAHKDVIGVGIGCYIDQIFGQTWAHWVGLGSIFDREKQLSALRALWRYNFVPDIGPFRRKFTAGRWYAMEGDGGLLMCTWPKGGKRDKWEDQWQFMYFNECMSGFEWQAASHMIFEGIDQPDILQSGLAISRAIHDRYNAKLRNPYNEIECSDHYARAMASYGVFQAVCGFQYHGPKGSLQLDPRLSPDAFKAPFVTAEGWGSYEQVQTGSKFELKLSLLSGKLRLTELVVRLPKGIAGNTIHFGSDIKLIDSEAVPLGDGLVKLKFQEKIIQEKQELHLILL